MSDPVVTKLKKEYRDAGITTCEMRWPHKCWNDNGLSFAHRRKRIDYKSCPEKLATMNQTLLLCPVAHNLIEYGDKIMTGRELTIKIFNELRSQDDL